jgi:isoleucyl-tRNA synthetase
MYVMADGLARLLAPILSFTTDELWRHLPGGREESVHLARFPDRAALARLNDQALIARWERLIAIRDQVLGRIEPLRKDKQIGSSLQAKVVLSASGADFELLKTHEAQLPMLFIVSEVDVREQAADGLEISIDRASGAKCERCWRYVPKVSTDPARPGICERCEDALAETVRS